jgi:lon-related putative ATP-dependent protease
MPDLTPLPPEALYRACDPAALGFATTEELGELDEVIGQERALAALRFGIGMRHDAYHLFALGPSGLGKHTVVRRLLEERAAEAPVPSDWCYVHNFAEPHRPRALGLPAGRGAKLRAAIDQLIEELRQAIPAVFESDDYRTRRQAIEEAAKGKQEAAFNALQEAAQARQVALVRTPVGMALAPVRDGEVLNPDQFQKLPPAEQAKIRADLEELQHQLEAILRQIPEWERAARAELRQLNREVTTFAVKHLIDELRKDYADLPAVQGHLDAIEQDLTASADQPPGAGPQPPALAAGLVGGPPIPQVDPFHRYRVNLLVDQSEASGAPVVYEDHPSHPNLIGRVEHIAQFGALVTDFSLIKAGALHRANGGYLVLDARRVLLQPFAWEELKRVLRAREIRIESLAQTLSLVSTVTLEPEPVPLDVKLVLIGERLLYYLLAAADPDFGELFKVPVDFADDVDRSADSMQRFARLLATMAKRAGLRPLESAAIARIIEHASRLAEDAAKLSINDRTLGDLLREADYFAAQNGHDRVLRADVQQALDAQVYRADRVRERVLEQIRRGTILIDTGQATLGQVNGLVVSTLGGFSFGRPIRITARVRLGRGQVVDIEREVEFGGPIHAKGVLILQGFLGARFAALRPLTLHASLVFEQSYGPVEGDSASAAELYALLSALAEAPVNQSFAVTGSVNQRGQIQPIGGVNEKIEGFFDVCRQAGLSGEQGVLIPKANVDHLMLREDVVAAVRARQFRIFAVETIDQGIELLTGVAAGAPGPDGAWPEGTINQRVEARLAEMAEAARRFGSRDGEERAR